MADRPNLLVFFTDQQRADVCGCYGGPQAVTPVLDGVAAQGVCFRTAYTPNPLCGPARASLQTGRYPTATGNVVNGIHLPEMTTTAARLLAGAGYATGYLGKWHLASTGADGPDCFRTTAVPPHRRGGFADWWLAADALEHTSRGYGGFMFDGNMNRVELPDDRYRVDVMTDHLLGAIDQFAGGPRPFFLMASFLEPHHQNDRHTFEAPRGWAGSFADARVPGDLLAQGCGDWRTEYANYLACCRSLDVNFGRVIERLAARGVAGNTLVVFVSDHGCHFATRNSEYKRSCHDASIHIPLVLRGPGFEGGRTVDGLASLLDIPPTLLRAAGVAVPADWHGRPLQELCAGDPSWRSAHLVQISESQCGRAIRTARWTYSVRDPDASPLAACGTEYIEDFLYDNEVDPNQLVNRVTDPALTGLRATLREQLVSAMLAAGEASPVIVLAGIAAHGNPRLHRDGAAVLSRHIHNDH